MAWPECVCCLAPHPQGWFLVTFIVCWGQTPAQDAGEGEGGLLVEDEGGVLVLTRRDWALWLLLPVFPIAGSLIKGTKEWREWHCAGAGCSPLGIPWPSPSL